MEMEKIQETIRRKPLLFLFVSLGYLAVVAFFRWNIHPTINTALFLLGGVVGIYFLDISEVFFHLDPSPFRSIVFAVAFAAVSLFIITSSTSLLAGGLVLSLYLSLILWQVGEWQINGHLRSWYRMVAGEVTVPTQRLLLAAFILFFFIETFLFAR